MNIIISCYICQKKIEQSHFHYKKLCTECGEYNLVKRNIHADLKGYTALVTGGRIKIGYVTSLRLLRDGAFVVVTTRYPMEAIIKYSNESDFKDWKDRLLIYKLDLKRVDVLDQFVNWFYKKFESLDILINNAAQTIRKPESYTKELEIQESVIRESIFQNEIFKNICDNHLEEGKQSLILADKFGLVTHIDDQNSWVLKAEDISITEFLEVQLINVTAPFILSSSLKQLMKNSSHKNKFIINVSSMEGKFDIKRKRSYHVHTNMAKASLNMMTKTLSREYARDRIFIYSVDPGWVSNQFPEQWQNTNSQNFDAPLDFDDAAARICNPIYQWQYNDKLDMFGVFLKNYIKVEW